MIKYAEYAFGIIFGAGKGSVEDKIFFLVLGDTNGEPWDKYLGQTDDVRDWKDPVKILGPREKSNGSGLLVLALGDVDGAS